MLIFSLTPCHGAFRHMRCFADARMMSPLLLPWRFRRCYAIYADTRLLFAATLRDTLLR